MRTSDHSTRVAVWGLTAVLLAPAAARPCSCGPTPAVAEELETADVVFAAEVTKLEMLPTWWATSGKKVDDGLLERNPGEPPFRVLKATFAVGKAWKGVTEPEVVVFTPADCCLCGTTFAIGQSYVVYAYRAKRDVKLWTSVCSRTRDLADAAEDLRLLGPPSLDLEAQRVGSAGSRKGAP